MGNYENMENQSKLLVLVGDGNQYLPYLNSSVQYAVGKYTELAQRAYVSGKGNETAAAAIMAIQDAYAKKEAKEMKKINDENLRLTRQLQSERRAGYINGTIVVYFVLLFGVLIALGLIIFQF